MSAPAAEEAVAGLSLKDDAAVTFAPNHINFVVPADAELGTYYLIDLDDGRQIKYELTAPAKAGEEHTVRIDSTVSKMSLTVTKGGKETKLGLTITNVGDDRHPVVTKVAEEGAAAGIVQEADIILSVSEGSFTVEATDHDSTSRLLRSARGTLKLEVLRPVPDVPTRILHSGFLHKRSPKTLLGASTWQRRWCELTTTQMIYWELNTYGAQKRSFLGAERGRIPLDQVAGVRTEAGGKGKANPRRVDVLMKNKRMFELAASSAEEASAFASAIRDALLAVLTAQPAPEYTPPEEETTTEEEAAAAPADEPPPEAASAEVVKNVRFKAESISY